MLEALADLPSNHLTDSISLQWGCNRLWRDSSSSCSSPKAVRSESPTHRSQWQLPATSSSARCDDSPLRLDVESGHSSSPATPGSPFWSDDCHPFPHTPEPCDARPPAASPIPPRLRLQSAAGHA